MLFSPHFSPLFSAWIFHENNNRSNNMASEKKTVKLLVVLGSPREDGATACMAEHLVQGVRDACTKRGVALEAKPTVRLFAHDIKLCAKCMECTKRKTLPSCVVDDDMRAIMTDILDADIIVHAMPVWYWTMPGLMKVYMERWSQLFALPTLTLRDDAKAAMRGTVMTALACSGDPDHSTMCADALRPWQRLAELVPDTFRWAGAVSASVSVRHDPDAQKRCYGLGETCVDLFFQPMPKCTIATPVAPFHKPTFC